MKEILNRMALLGLGILLGTILICSTVLIATASYKLFTQLIVDPVAPKTVAVSKLNMVYNAHGQIEYQVDVIMSNATVQITHWPSKEDAELFREVTIKKISADKKTIDP